MAAISEDFAAFMSPVVVAVSAVERMSWDWRPPIYAPLEAVTAGLAGSIGIADDAARYVIGILLAFVFAPLVWRTPVGIARHIVHLAFGLFVAVFAMPRHWLMLLLSAAIGHVSVALLGRVSPLAVMAIMLTLITVTHLHRMATDYAGWSLDSSGPLMMMVMKVTSLAYSYYDGGAAQSGKLCADVTSTASDKGTERQRRIALDRLRARVTHMPGILQYWGWILSPLAVLAGSMLDYCDHAIACEAGAPGQAATPTRDDFRAALSSWDIKARPGLEPAALARVHVVMGLKAPAAAAAAVSSAASPLASPQATQWASASMNLVFAALALVGAVIQFRFFAADDAMYESLFPYPDWTQPLTTHIAGGIRTAALCAVWIIMVRCRYYFAWTLISAATALAGMGFRPEPTEAESVASDEWEGATGVDIVSVELSQTVSELTRSWNRPTQRWLERFVYLRAPRGWQMFAIYFVSALWHGLYPGYFLFFLSMPLLSEVQYAAHEKLWPLTQAHGRAIAPVKRVYDLISWLAVHGAVAGNAPFFIALTWERSVRVLLASRGIPLGLTVLAWVVLRFVPTPRHDSSSGAHKKKAE